MKRILSVLLIAGITFGATAQDKKIRGGLVTGFTINNIATNSTKIQKAGVGGGFVIGMTGEYNINQNIALSTGLEFNIESFTLNYGSDDDTKLTDVFYAYDDTDINKFDGKVIDPKGNKAFLLHTRKFRAKYVTLPIFLKFQTNMIGDFKYYGKMGLRTSVLAGIRMDDKGYESIVLSNDKDFKRVGSSTLTKENMKPDAFKKGLSLIKMGIGIYGGAEWNFTGNTNLYAEMGFNFGVTPVLWQESGHLVETEAKNGGNTEYDSVGSLDVKSNPMHTFELKVGLLF